MSKIRKNIDMKNTPNYGPIIKRLRIAASMTQDDLCEATNFALASGYLSRLERKPYAVSIPILQALCEALGVSLADMIREESGGEPISGTYSRQIVVRDMEGEKTEQNIPAVTKTNPKAFALKVTDTAMESQGGVSYFKDGYVLVDPDGEIESGSDYVFRIDDHLIIGRYETNGRRNIISYLNPKYPNETIDDDPDIKGKIIGFYFYTS